MYILIAGGGKVGANLASTLQLHGHEITLMEADRRRYERLEQRFGNTVRHADTTEVFELEAAGVERCDLLIAVTGDDQDNLVACQLARDKYGTPKVIARVNDPRNQPHFAMLGIDLTVSATSTILTLIEHELPQHDLLTMLDLRHEDLAIVELVIPDGSRAEGRLVSELDLPDRARLISITHDDTYAIASGESRLHAGDRIMAILAPALREALERAVGT